MRGLLSYWQITSSLSRSFSPARNFSKAILITRFSRITSQPPSTRFFTLTIQSKMSYSNTDTGDKPADPYKAQNLDEPPLREKVDGLVNFISTSKFGMLTTRAGSTGLLASRAMAVAGQVKKPSSAPSSRLTRVYLQRRVGGISVCVILSSQLLLRAGMPELSS